MGLSARHGLPFKCECDTQSADVRGMIYVAGSPPARAKLPMQSCATCFCNRFAHTPYLYRDRWTSMKRSHRDGFGTCISRRLVLHGTFMRGNPRGNRRQKYYNPRGNRRHKYYTLYGIVPPPVWRPYTGPHYYLRRCRLVHARNPVNSRIVMNPTNTRSLQIEVPS